MTIRSQEINDYRVEFELKTSIKGQVQANFVEEFMYNSNIESDKEDYAIQGAEMDASGPR